ncbi:MAG: HDOD domain-containing protein [Campylobacterales bacterium]
MNESLFTRIKSLPPLPESVAKIQAICNDPNAGVADLAKVVEQDPMLTANLLKAANSPLYGFSREIKTLTQAVSLFGMATVRGFALASAVKSTLTIDMSPYKLNAERFADLSQLQNALMVRWYGQVNRAMLDILSPAAFLIGVGRVIMAQEIVKEGKTEAFLKLAAEKGSWEAAEEALLDISYQEVSAAVFRHWRFEPAMVEAIRGSHNPNEVEAAIAPYALALKVVQSAVSLPGGLNDESLKAAQGILEAAKMDVEKFNKAAKELAPA